MGEAGANESRGKRIRPLLVLLTCLGVSDKWLPAIPGAAAVELLHNFSLIHDDIQDESPLRRGRPTTWRLWGIAQAINAGDTMFTLANQAILGFVKTTTPEITLQSIDLLQHTCLSLTHGQYLDLSYENRTDISLESYWSMISGKTAALISACTEIGALAGGAKPPIQLAYREFGRNLGLAFQVKDDYLGIWGDSKRTGKSADHDLMAGKKSIPILFGMESDGPFAKRWKDGGIQADEVVELAHQLEVEGARDYTLKKADELTTLALNSLEAANPRGEAGEALSELSNLLLGRSM